MIGAGVVVALAVIGSFGENEAPESIDPAIDSGYEENGSVFLDSEYTDFNIDVTEPPVTEPPVTDPPVTDPPVTEPPVTDPPVTEPPVTEPPVTEPPVTEPPVTEPPVTDPPVTEPPVTEPPVTNPPVTEPIAPEFTSTILQVRRNEIVTVTVKGLPNTMYTIVVQYHSGHESEANGLGEAMSDKNGNVTWTWKVGGKTGFGLSRFIVRGGGTQATYEFEVVE